MFYLIYVSSAHKLLSDGELFELLNQSRTWNKEHNITGMLLYKGGNFMQYIEGEKENILSLYDRIVKDRRHHGIIKIDTANINERNFHDWSMGFRNMDKDKDKALPKYNDYAYENIDLKSFNNDSEGACAFIKLFNKFNTHS
jgi:hypothetical protein